MFSVGDKVIAIGNYLDEQLGEFAHLSVQVIIEIKNDAPCKSGQWIKTDKSFGEWIDSDWFMVAVRII